MNAPAYKGLIVEDDEQTVRLVSTTLRLNRCAYESVGTIEGARQMLAEGEFHFVTLDMQLPLGSDDDALVSNGFKFLQELRGEYPELPIIVITGTYNVNFLRFLHSKFSLAA